MMTNRNMLSLLALLIVVIAGCLCQDENTISENGTAAVESQLDPIDYLTRFGYTDVNVQFQPNLARSAAAAAFNNSLRLFQEINHLNVTGELDDATIKLMNTPRCGLSDLPSKSNNNTQRFLTSTGWNFKILNYKINTTTKHLTEAQTRDIIKRAFSLWSNNSDITFMEVPLSDKKTDVDIVINFAKFAHGDGSDFDGPGGVLAHAFFPEDGRIHFDESEKFTDASYEGINLFAVAAHEIGHALGIDHSTVQSALMYPYYGGYIPNYVLPTDDILAIQAIYGARKPEIPHVAEKKSAQNPSPCNSTLESVFLGPSNLIYALTSGENLWQYDLSSGHTWKRAILSRTYKNLDSGFRGGVRCQNRTWFFKGKQVWAFDEYKLSLLWTINDRLYPNSPTASLCKNDKLFLIKDNFLYQFDTNTLRIKIVTYLSDTFPELNRIVVESALTQNGIVYFFKDKKVWKYEEKTHKLIGGSSHSIFTDWLPCLA